MDRGKTKPRTEMRETRQQVRLRHPVTLLLVRCVGREVSAGGLFAAGRDGTRRRVEPIETRARARQGTRAPRSERVEPACRCRRLRKKNRRVDVFHARLEFRVRRGRRDARNADALGSMSVLSTARASACTPTLLDLPRFRPARARPRRRAASVRRTHPVVKSRQMDSHYQIVPIHAFQSIFESSSGQSECFSLPTYSVPCNMRLLLP